MNDQRRGYHHGDLRQAMLDEGLEVVRSGGLDSLAVRDVTRRLGVAPNAAYRHFADRDAFVAELARTVQRTLSQIIHDRMRRAHRRDSPTSPEGQLIAFARAYVEFAIDEPAWFDLLCRGGAEQAAPQPTGDQPEPSPHEVLQSALAEFAAEGSVAEAKIADAVWMIWAALDGLTRLVGQGPLQAWSRSKVRAFIDRMLTTILAGLSTDQSVSNPW